MTKLQNKIKITAGLFSAMLLSSCATSEIQQLQYSVNQLEQRVQSYQQETTEDTVETTSSLSEMSRSINTAFRDIRYAQSNLETLTDSFSSRLSKVETDVESLKSRLSRIDSFSSESANLAQDLKRQQDISEKQLGSTLQSLQQEIQALKQENAALTQSVQSMQSSHSSLTTRLSSLENSSRDVYKKILNELGAEDSYSGKTYTVNPGDTLSKIASQFGVESKAIQDLNGITDPSKIRIGQVLQIP